MPPGLRGALLQAKQLHDWHSDSLQQIALAQFMISGEFSRHTRRMQREYAQRRTRLLQRLDGDLAPWLRPIVPMAGIHLAAWLNEGGDMDTLLDKSRKRGIGLNDLRVFYQHEAPRGLLLGFGGVDLTELDEGLDQLRAVLLELAPQHIADHDRKHL
jgi:GntR family transcriptional regulator/MocR family aminotransferase